MHSENLSLQTNVNKMLNNTVLVCKKYTHARPPLRYRTEIVLDPNRLNRKSMTC